MRTSLVAILLFAGASVHAPAQQVEQARVLFVNDSLVQIDHGSEEGVEPGDVVWFRPLGQSQVRGVVQSVQRRTAWVALEKASTGVLVGTMAEVKIDRSEPSPGKDANLRNPGARLPSEPPVWTSPEQDWDPDRPLLEFVPYEKEATPAEWNGRLYTIVDFARESDLVHQDSLFSRVGLGLYGSNPFGMDGEFRLDFDVDYRSFQSSSGNGDSGADGDQRSSAIRLERFSYRRGGNREQPMQWQVGRFLNSEFPEFGVLDGAELVYRLPDGARIGGSLGYLPEPGQDYETGKDFQISTTYRDFVGEQQQWSWGAGLQKSWHRGAPDRDLAVLRSDYYGSQNFNWHSSLWLDFYGSSDAQKDAAVEISMFTSMLNWRQNSHGSSLGLRHWRFPQLQRFQAGDFLIPDLSDARTTRLDGGHWRQLTTQLRLHSRADVWQSDSRNGWGGSLRLDYSAAFGPGSSSWMEVYRLESNSHEATGVRLGQVLPIERGSLRLWWDSARYRPMDDEGSLVQHDARLAWDFWSQSSWSSTVDVGRRFGDEQDSYSLGLYLQRVF